MIRIAVLADPHLHDTRFGSKDGAVVRSLADTVHSTRVSNESGPALDRALAEIADERIGLCLIVGDLTDDGQPANWAAATARLAEHSARHGTRFFATPGNHDQWGLTGKALGKGCVDAVGRICLADGPEMRMLGFEASLEEARAPGYRPIRMTCTGSRLSEPPPILETDAQG
jgi:hypothetical protein